MIFLGVLGVKGASCHVLPATCTTPPQRKLGHRTMAEEAVSGVPLVGSRISLISKKDIRYEGVLFSINTNDASLALQHGEFLLHE